jgi:hypothetical protein
MLNQLGRIAVVALCGLGLAAMGCGVVGASLLDQYWVNQLNDNMSQLEQDVQDSLDQPGVPGPQGEPGQDGAAGADGRDGIDGVDGVDGQDGVDGIDGVDGQDGTNGQNGQDGKDGTDGVDGADGLSCWDLNGNGLPDLATEDVNGDDVVDALDCVGEQGPQGDPGVLARAQIEASGDVRNLPNAVSCVWEDDGKYFLTVQLPDSFDYTDWEPLDYPVSLSVEPIFPNENGNAPLIAGAFERLEKDNDPSTLEFRVHIRKISNSEYTDASFTFVLLQP